LSCILDGPTVSSKGSHFFFSSRRRHTRFSRDWSSDVCSSDLSWSGRAAPTSPTARHRLASPPRTATTRSAPRSGRGCSADRLLRSEERRVGKEGRSRGSPWHEERERRSGRLGALRAEG